MDERMERGLSSDGQKLPISIEKFGRAKVTHYWPQIEQALDATKELWYPAYSKDEILERLITEHMQAWAVAHGDVLTICFLTQIVNTRTSRLFQVFWMYGEGMIEALPLLDLALDDFAATFGCDTIEVVGRKGFDRLLRPRGFEFHSAMFHRPVRAKRKGS